MTKPTDTEKATLAVFGVIAVFVGMILLRTFVAVNLWSWIVSPIFHLPRINLAQAFGLNVLFSYFAGSNRKNGEDGDTKSSATKMFVTAASFTLVTWGLGAIAALIMHTF